MPFENVLQCPLDNKSKLNYINGKCLWKSLLALAEFPFADEVACFWQNGSLWRVM